MFVHYLIIALRNIRKYILQNAVSIVGLVAGFVAFALSSLWMSYVDSYDSYHKDADRIYTFSFNEDGRTTVGNERTRTNGDIFWELYTCCPWIIIKCSPQGLHFLLFSLVKVYL